MPEPIQKQCPRCGVMNNLERSACYSCMANFQPAYTQPQNVSSGDERVAKAMSLMLAGNCLSEIGCIMTIGSVIIFIIILLLLCLGK